MGQHLEAHRARYIADGDFPSFWLGFDAALAADARAARRARQVGDAFALMLAQGIDGNVIAWAEDGALTPAELLAALEPPGTEIAQRREAVEQRPAPLTFYDAWEAFTRPITAAWQAMVTWLLHLLTNLLAPGSILLLVWTLTVAGVLLGIALAVLRFR